jgi:hypothetical protein
MQVAIGESIVTLRDKIRTADGYRLPEMAAKLQDGNLLDAVPVLQIVVESWTLPGDPRDPAAYDDLDFAREFLPLVAAAAEYVRVMFEPLNTKVSEPSVVASS